MKIFNKIRSEMLKEKRFTNYIAYAIGEIILVVVGILIALWLNNWNKEQQITDTNNNLQNRVLVQLEKDIRDIDKFRNELDTLDNVYLKTLGRKYDKIKVDDGSLISTILFDVKDLGLDKQNVNWIDNAVLDNSEASESLVYLSSLYKLYFKNIDDIEKIIYEKFTTNLAYLESTQPWYTMLITDFRCENDCINYLLYDEGHKARIASLRFLYMNGYGDLVKGFYSDLMRYKKKLERLMEDAAA
ncbi:hypothetical protein [Winogradskyella sp. UBA3174]|uniref:hypothetical protein n=1 Tax=Winogradskyella sp. UBA3174 TaxID=1947785 RepID=UPI0025CF264B|nr:hypothetical protein [Winogradskyella sp. UBA3174]|tara:strand:+ start:29308 stop:30039 length:732 start_codon:yes stop_codon:yes gene_type:complete